MNLLYFVWVFTMFADVFIPIIVYLTLSIITKRLAYKDMAISDRLMFYELIIVGIVLAITTYMGLHPTWLNIIQNIVIISFAGNYAYRLYKNN